MYCTITLTTLSRRDIFGLEHFCPLAALGTNPTNPPTGNIDIDIDIDIDFHITFGAHTLKH